MGASSNHGSFGGEIAQFINKYLPGLVSRALDGVQQLRSRHVRIFALTCGLNGQHQHKRYLPYTLKITRSTFAEVKV